MKANTTKEYPFIGDYYKYTLVTSADGTVSNRVYTTVPETIYMRVSVNLLGDLVIESQTKMQLNSYLKNIKDRNGDEIYSGGTWRIFQTAPLINGLAIKDGYKYRAELIAGNV
jgi:hypothetical protein